MIYESGTSIVDMKGVSVYERGSVVSDAQLAGRSETHTLLAKRVMPPARPRKVSVTSARTWTFLVFAGIFGGIAYLAYLSDKKPSLSGGICFILAMVMVYKANQAGAEDRQSRGPSDEELQRQWQAQMETWRNSWLCLRCGNEFAESSTGIVTTESIGVQVKRIRDTEGTMVAIKYYVETTQCNLLEAKRYVESL